jgi:hypothetical protein
LAALVLGGAGPFALDALFKPPKKEKHQLLGARLSLILPATRSRNHHTRSAVAKFQ